MSYHKDREGVSFAETLAEYNCLMAKKQNDEKGFVGSEGGVSSGSGGGSPARPFARTDAKLPGITTSHDVKPFRTSSQSPIPTVLYLSDTKMFDVGATSPNRLKPAFEALCELKRGGEDLTRIMPYVKRDMEQAKKTAGRLAEDPFEFDQKIKKNDSTGVVPTITSLNLDALGSYSAETPFFEKKIKSNQIISANKMSSELDCLSFEKASPKLKASAFDHNDQKALSSSKSDWDWDPETGFEGISEFEEKRHNGNFDFECLLCNAKCNGLASKEAHLNGSKHRKNNRKNLTLETDVTTELENSFLLEDEAFLGLEFVKEFKFGDKIRYKCHLCDKVLDSENLKEHILSLKHRKKYIKKKKSTSHDHLKTLDQDPCVQTPFVKRYAKEIEDLMGRQRIRRYNESLTAEVEEEAQLHKLDKLETLVRPSPSSRSPASNLRRSRTPARSSLHSRSPERISSDHHLTHTSRASDRSRDHSRYTTANPRWT